MLKQKTPAPKQPIKKLPASVELGPDTTVEDVKKMIAKQVGFSDYNRVGIYDPSTKKTLKNRMARISEEPGVTAANEVLVKDLGTSNH